MTVEPTVVISALSLAVSVISFVMNYRLNKRDEVRSEQLAEMQLRIQEFQLRKVLVAGSPSKFVITTQWTGFDGKDHSRDNIISW